MEAIQIGWTCQELCRGYRASGSSDFLGLFGALLNFLAAYGVRRVLVLCEK